MVTHGFDHGHFSSGPGVEADPGNSKLIEGNSDISFEIDSGQGDELLQYNETIILEAERFFRQVISDSRE